MNNLFPRPAKLTKYPDIGVVAALLTAATITQTPTGKLKFKSLGLDIPEPKDESEWGTWNYTAAPVVTPRPHHKPILTEAMKKENGVGGWGRVSLLENFQPVNSADSLFRATGRPTLLSLSLREVVLACRTPGNLATAGKLGISATLADLQSPGSGQQKAAMPSRISLRVVQPDGRGYIFGTRH